SRRGSNPEVWHSNAAQSQLDRAPGPKSHAVGGLGAGAVARDGLRAARGVPGAWPGARRRRRHGPHARRQRARRLARHRGRWRGGGQSGGGWPPGRRRVAGRGGG
ncbi:unnamed protein product, partial [Prorocentrum cordatum]